MKANTSAYILVALTRYREIISAPDAWIVDFDSVSEAETKPTKSALRLRDLLETITDRYRLSKSFTHKIRFLMDIQVSILESYHGRISASLDAFESMSSPIVRAVSGVHEDERKKMIDGLAGIERLSRAYGSAFFIRDALNDWGEDIFFLELNDELSKRARNNQSEGGGNKTLDENGAIFDGTIKAYDELQARAESLIVKHLQREVQKAYKNDISFRQFVKSKSVIKDDFMYKSADISEMLLYISRSLSRICFARVTRSLKKSFDF